MKKTKIIASLGPSSNSSDTILEMAKLGVDVFRINLSHATLEECSSLISKIRSAEKKLKKIIGIMLDTDGPGIRLDKLNEDETFLAYDKEVRFYNYHVVCNNTQLSTNFSNLTDAIKLNDILLLSNGEVKLQVIEVNDDNFIAKVKEEGIIKSNQTVHIVNSNYRLPFMSDRDKENILYAIENNVDFLALSFVRDEQDVLEVVDMLIENGNEHISIISKIENEFAFDNLEEILKVSDGVMVGRGDFGINVSLEKLPYYQKQILMKANEEQKIGLVATDFLKTMIHGKNPSRAEVVDIYNAVLDKADGIVLCDETTIGENPIACIEVLEKVIIEAEKDFPYHKNLEDTFKQGKLDVTSTIAYSVVDSGLLLNANCILANTMSGYTAKKISYFRPKSPILGLSPNLNTARSLTLNYAIIPVHVKKFTDTDDIVSECLNKYKEIMDYQENDIVIITGGLPLNNKNTDFMKIEKIESD